MSDTANWREDEPGVFVENDGAARVALAVMEDEHGNQVPAFDDTTGYWPADLLYALQAVYDSALKTTTVNGQECVVVHIPEPA